MIDDIAAKDGTLTTDGCGLIRESRAREVRPFLIDAEPQSAGAFLFMFSRFNSKHPLQFSSSGVAVRRVSS